MLHLSNKKIHLKYGLLLSGLALTLCSCNVYKSEGRKSLEAYGPPPGSLKTTSLNLLIAKPDLEFKSDNLIFDVCELAHENDTFCKQRLQCFKTTDEELTKHLNDGSQTEIAPQLLLNESNHDETFDSPLICRLKP